MTRCWKPGCRVAPTATLAGDGWLLRACRRHEEVARAVTGIRKAKVPRDMLFEVAT